MFPWRDALWNVKPDMLICWHQGFRLFWRWKSRPTGRPRLPTDLRRLIREMAARNVTWREERIARELKLKLGIRVSPCTVGKYLRVGRVSVREYLRRCRTRAGQRSSTPHPCRPRCSTYYRSRRTTMSSGSRKWRREARIGFLRSTPHSDLLCGMGSFVTKESQARI